MDTSQCRQMFQQRQAYKDYQAKLFRQQYDCLSKTSTTGDIRPRTLYGNTALLAQDVYNPITFWLYQQPK